MAGYQTLSEFERGVIAGAQEKGHSISEVAMEFGFSSTTISRVYRRYQEYALPQIAADFNAGSLISVIVRAIQRNIINMGIRSRKLTRYPC
ncbi:HTH_Tnp_Tc3_2 domain-containing protein [Trichonephila clavipes]|nr:HTH_Tnp_Tc3_2 domain-containing protein [Trichonephila clavipes]